MGVRHVDAGAPACVGGNRGTKTDTLQARPVVGCTNRVAIASFLAGWRVIRLVAACPTTTAPSRGCGSKSHRIPSKDRYRFYDSRLMFWEVVLAVGGRIEWFGVMGGASVL